MASCIRASAVSLRLITRQVRSYSVVRPPVRPAQARQVVFGRFEALRFASTAPRQYVYEDIKKLASNPVPDKVLVDVREPAELQAEGQIPTAINIPYKSAPDALSLSDEAFEAKFGFAKPSKDKELIFYCLGGVRSNYAQELAGEFGYDKRGNYAGSWEDWVEKGKGK